MSSFNKVLNSKIVLLIIVCVFLLISTAYGIDLSEKSHLRKPLDFNNIDEAGRYRRALLEAANSKDILEVELGQIVSNGVILRARASWNDNGDASVVFYNSEDRRVGFVDILRHILKAGNSSYIYFTLNFVYIEKEFRAKGYSRDMLSAVLDGLRKTGALICKEDANVLKLYISMYVRNPLVVEAVKDSGFEQISYPVTKALETTVIVYPKDESGTIRIYVEDEKKKEDVKESFDDLSKIEILDQSLDNVEGKRVTIFTNYVWYFDSSSPAERYKYKKEPAVEFSNGLIDIENLGESEIVFPITSFSGMGTLFPVTDLEPRIMKFIQSLGIRDLSVALDDLVLNAIEHQFGSPGPVSIKIETFKNGEILKITIQQPSSSKDARDRLGINKKGFDLQGPDYLIDVQERMRSSAFIRRGGAFRVIGDLIRFNSACLIYKIGREEPFPLETNFYIFIERRSLDKLKQAIPSKDLETGL